MKKTFKYMACLVSLCLLTGCRSSGDTASQEEDDVIVVDADSDEEAASGELSVDLYTESTIDLENYALDDSCGTQFCWNYCAATDDGYYFVEENYLRFYDIASGQTVYVCDRADCRHNDTGCNAYFQGGYTNTVLSYYDGYLYMLYDDFDVGEVSLCRIAADGSGREDTYMTLYRAAQQEDGTTHLAMPYYCVCDDAVYFMLHDESVPKIRRMELGSSKSEVVYTSSGVRADLYRLRLSGDYLFFQCGNYTDEDCAHIKGGIFAYNLKNESCVLVKEDAISNYTVQNDTLYYALGSAIYAKSLTDGEETLLIEDTGNSLPEFNVSGEYLYVWDGDTSTLIAYDLEVNEIVSLKDKSVEECYWGDGTYYIGTYSAQMGNGSVTRHVILNVEDFLKGNGSWENLT